MKHGLRRWWIAACVGLAGGLPLAVNGAPGVSTVYGVLTVNDPGTAGAGGLSIAAGGSVAITRPDGSFHLNGVPAGPRIFEILDGTRRLALEVPIPRDSSVVLKLRIENGRAFMDGYSTQRRVNAAAGNAEDDDSTVNDDDTSYDAVAGALSDEDDASGPTAQ